MDKGVEGNASVDVNISGVSVEIDLDAKVGKFDSCGINFFAATFSMNYQSFRPIM
jgi:hypothetical protein